MFDGIVFEHHSVPQELTESEIKIRNSTVPLSVVFVFVQEQYSINHCGQRLMLNFGFAFHHLTESLFVSVSHCIRFGMAHNQMISLDSYVASGHFR